MKNLAMVSFRFVAAVLFLALGMTTTALGQSPFTAGNIVVVQMGDGSGALSSAAAPVSLREYTPSGSLVQTITFASTGSSPRLVVTGSSGSEGHVVRSSDGNYLTIVGYDTVAGVSGFAIAAVRRDIARIDASGTINHTTEFTDGSTTAVRSAVTDNGSNTWTATSSIGVRYKSFGSTGTSTQLSTTPTNTRVVKIFNGQLYITSSSGAYLGVSSIGSGTPTTSGQSTTALPGMPTSGTHSAYSFSISPDGNTLYIADDGAASAGGGIQKWTFNGSTWSLAYTLLNNGSTTTGTRGLAVDWSGASPVIYATTSAASPNTLIKVVDTGSGSTATTVATAPTYTVFRGVDFTPATAASAPTATTNPATSISATGATLNGSVNANGASTTVSFDYGTTALYGTNVAGTPSPVTGGTNTAVSAAITSLTPNQLYHFRVNGTNSVATTNGSDTTFTTLPTAPTATSASSVGETGFTANWTASGDVNAPSTYTLEVATSSGFGGTIIQTDPGLPGTSFAVTTSLSGGITYYYRVTAVGSAGSSAPSNTISQLTLPPAPVATAPSNVIAASFDANWNAATSAASYRLDVATDIGFSSFVSGYNDLTVNATTQTVSGLSSTIKYYYRARAVNATGTSANGTIDSATTIAAAAPTVNTPTAVSIGNTSATLGANVFSDNNDADFQRGVVWAATANPDTNSNRVIASGTGTGVFTAPVTGLTAGTLIHYRGYAINHFGIGYTSDATFYTLSAEPATQATGFAAAAPFAAAIGLSWTASADGNGYLILQKTGSDPADVPSDARRYSVGDSIGTSRVVAFITSNATVSASVTGLAGSTNYHYAIMTFAWDGTNNGTINYNTNSIPTSNTTTLSNLSDIVATPGFVYASSIPYLTYTGIGDITKLNSVAAFGLTVRDGGSDPDADAAGTTLTSISFSVTNWSFLSRAALYLGDTTELGEVAVSSGTVAFGGLTGAVAPDGGTATLVLRVVYNNTVTDNARNTYTVSSAVADSTGSVFAAANGGGAVSSTSGTDNVVSVVATQLIFSPNVANGKYNVAFSATAKAVDVNNNVDSDYVSPQVTFTKASGSGNLTGNSPVTPVKGVATEATLVLDQGGTYTLQASSGSLSGTSNSFLINAPATFKVNAGADTLYWDSPSTWVVVRGGSVTGIPHKADSVIFDHQFHTGKYVVCPARNALDTSSSAPTDTVGQLTIGYPGNPDTVELYIPPGGFKNTNAAVLWGDSVAGNYDIVIAERGVVRDSKWSYSKSVSYKSTLDSIWIRSGGLWYHNTTGYPTMLAKMSHRLDGDYGTVEFDVDSRQGSFDINAPGYYYPNVVFSNRTGYAPKYYLYSTGSSGALYIKGNLTINTGAVDSLCSGYPVVVYGNIVNNGTMKAALTPSTIVFGGSTTQTVSGSSPFVTNGGFVSLNPGGVNFSTDAYVTGGTVQTTGTYTYDSSGGKMVTFPVAGVINTGLDTLFLNPAGGQTMNEGTNPVQGNVSSNRTLLQNSNVDFGNGFQMDALGGAPGSTTVFRKTGVADSGYAHNKSILRHYDVTAANNTALNATIAVGYAPTVTELNGISQSNLLLQKSADYGTTWAGKKGTLDSTLNHQITATGIPSPNARWTMASATAPLFVPHAIVIRSFKDTVGTVAPQAAQKWRLALYQDSVTASTLINSGFLNSGILGTTYLASGTYILAENDSAGWVHIGKIHHGTSIGNAVISGSTRYDTIVVTDLSPGSADTVDFINQQVSSITVVKLRDFNHGVIPQKWHLWLYKDMADTAHIITQADTSLLVAPSLQAGKYIAVEADSGAPWYRLNGNHTCYDTLTLLANQSIADTFINLKGNKLVVQNWEARDGKFSTRPDTGLKTWYFAVRSDSANGPLLPWDSGNGYIQSFSKMKNAPLVALATSGPPYNQSLSNLKDVECYVSEADSTGWLHLGYVLNGVGTATGTNHISVSLSNGQVDTIAFVNAPPLYSQTFRTFRPDSIANAGVVTKAVVPTVPNNVEFTVTVVNESTNVGNLHMEFADAVIDSSIRPFTINPPATKGMVANSKGAKWDFAFVSPIGPGTSVTVSGWATTTKAMQKVTKYRWMRGQKKLGKSDMTVLATDPGFTVNQLHEPMPNIINVLSQAYNDVFNVGNGKTDSSGMTIGVRVDSLKADLAWVTMQTYAKLTASMYVKPYLQTGTARGLDFKAPEGVISDTTKSSDWLKGTQKSLSPKAVQSNALFGNLVALKLSIGASYDSITPVGLGELVYDDGTLNPLNGMHVKDIALKADTLMTGYVTYRWDTTWNTKHTVPKLKLVRIRNFADYGTYLNLSNTIYSIDTAFQGPMDTLSFSTGLVVKGTRRLVGVGYLRADPNMLPSKNTGPRALVTAEYVTPVAYTLYQNYPNPFNPTTTIRFDLPQQAVVTLKIYNILGQEVATLFDRQQMDNGTQEVQFNASRFASGVYFYRMIAEGMSDDGMKTSTYVTVKKMLLLK